MKISPNSELQMLITALKSLGWDLAVYEDDLGQGMLVGEKRFILNHLRKQYKHSYIRLPSPKTKHAQKKKLKMHVNEDESIVSNKSKASLQIVR